MDFRIFVLLYGLPFLMLALGMPLVFGPKLLQQTWDQRRQRAHTRRRRLNAYLNAKRDVV